MRKFVLARLDAADDQRHRFDAAFRDSLHVIGGLDVQRWIVLVMIDEFGVFLAL